MHQLSGLYFVFLVDADLERFLRFLENLLKKKKKTGIHLLSVRFHATSVDHCGKKKQLIRTSVLAYRLQMYELHTIYQILSFNAVHNNTIILDKHTLEMKMRGVWYTKLTETLGGNFY